MSHQFELEGKVVVLTGGAGMLGREYIRFLSQQGVHLVVADLETEATEAAAAQAKGAAALAVPTDITQPNQVQALVARVQARFGRLDGLINNAALNPKFDQAHAAEHTTKFENFPLAQWRAALDVNLTGMFLVTQALTPLMLAGEGASVINISSTYGMGGPDQKLYEKADPAAPKTFKPITYTVTKSAVFGFTKYLATYFADNGIRVNTLTLGGVFVDHDTEFTSKYAARTPLARMAERHEYNGALAFLLSDASSYMTGSNLVIDGGWTAW